MPRREKRFRIARCIYRDGTGGYEVRATVGGHTYWQRMPKDSTLEELKKTRAQLESKGRTETPRAERGTLYADTWRYIKLIKHLASWEDREDHLNRWCVRLGDVFRHRITHTDVLAARVAWLYDGLAPKTVNHHVATLRHLYRTLDGKTAPTPCDAIDPLPVPKTPICRISDEMILDVDRNLQALEARRDAPPWNAKTRARFRVFVSTGKRPCEIMRAKPEDVDLEARVWVPRDAKGGFCPGVYLNDDARAAWELFIQSNAWGTYSTGNFARTLRSAGWPEGIRPYHARHTYGITLSERGIDLSDVATAMGHRDPRMTRRHYVPVLGSRLQRLSEALEGRFKGWVVEATCGDGRKS